MRLPAQPPGRREFPAPVVGLPHSLQACIFSQEIPYQAETGGRVSAQPTDPLRGILDVSNENGFCPNRVRELRENRLMTQAQLARKAKVALRTIHSVEKGMNCRMDTKRKILLALGLRFEDKDQVFPSQRRSRDLPPMRPPGEGEAAGSF